MARITKRSRTVAPLSIAFDREEDGRWIAEVLTLPGVMAYGDTKREAQRKVHAIALRTLADRVEQGSTPRQIAQLFEYGVARG